MKYVLIFFLTLTPFWIFAQAVEKEPLPALFNIGLEYGYQYSGGDLKDRFGNSNTIGTKMEYLTSNNFSLSGQYSFSFGRIVKEDPLLAYRNADSLFIGSNLSQASVGLRQRGFYVGGAVGKLFPLIKSNRRSGLKIEIGIGLLQHKIRVQEDPESFVPILAGDYKKGFDQLSNGLSLRQFIGYQHHSKNRLVNFYAGFEFTQAFTQNRRTYNYNTKGPDTTKRLDLLNGFKVAWVISIYVGEQGEQIYY